MLCLICPTAAAAGVITGDLREGVPSARPAAASGVVHTLQHETAPALADALHRLGFLLLGHRTDILDLSRHKVADEQRYLRLDRDNDRSHLADLHNPPVRGQKNSGFLIWLGYSYMTQVTSVAGGLYSIWQNIINSLELYEQSHRTGKRINKH